LFGNPERAGVQISPDGKYLAWLAPSEGVLNVWVAPVGDLERARAVTADKTRPVSRYVWTFDGKHLLYLQDKAGDENFHVFRVNAGSGEVLDLTPVDGVRAQVYSLSARKPHTVLVGMNERDRKLFDVHELDLRTGERKPLVLNDRGFVGYNIDNDLRVRFAQQMTPDGASVLFAYDAKGKSWTEHDRVPDEDLLTTAVLGFDKLGASYYAFDSRGRNTGALYRVDVKTKQKKLIHEDTRVDVKDVMVHPTEFTPQAVLVNYERPAWVAIDASVRRDLESLARLGDGTLAVRSRTLDDKVWVVSLESDTAPAKYYRWHRPTQKAEFLFSARPKLDDQPLTKMRPVVIRSRDGLELVSYLSLPKDADPDGDGSVEHPLPMVLLVHGGPWGRDNWGFDPQHQLLANRGYAVLSVNFRGSTGFGKAFTNAGDRQWGKKMHEDLLDAVAWAVERKIAPKERICIMGASYGGYATLAGLTLTPDVFACGVDIVGPSNIITLLDSIPPYWAPVKALFHTRIGDPGTPEGKQGLLAVSPLTHAANIQRPLLIAQGANDPRVKKSESDQIVRAMQAKKIPVSYVVFPDEGHGFARPQNNIAFFALTEAFLSAHLGGWFQPVTQEELHQSSLVIEAGRELLPGVPR
jgi:dipeptidyl aminopeptidase/acylaminoacyl peptidase